MADYDHLMPSLYHVASLHALAAGGLNGCAGSMTSRESTGGVNGGGNVSSHTGSSALHLCF